MLKFIDKAEYQLITAQWLDDDTISWTYTEGATTHSGAFIRGRKFNHTRGSEESPTSFIPFDEVQAETTVLPHDIDKLKSEAIAEINQQRDQRIHGGIEYNGHTFQTDAQSILDVMGAVIAQVQVDWLTADNQTVSMSSADMAALGQALAAHKGSLVHQARTHKDNILAMTTASEIEQYMQTISWS